MISAVQSGWIFTKDQERSKKFWVEQMGFRVTQFTRMGDGPHWIEVTPPGAKTSVVLYTPPNMMDRVGTFSNLIFEAEDVFATAEELKAKGVEFPGPPQKAAWGAWAVFKDPDGNMYGLREPGKPMPANGSEGGDLPDASGWADIAGFGGTSG